MQNVSAAEEMKKPEIPTAVATKLNNVFRRFMLIRPTVQCIGQFHRDTQINISHLPAQGAIELATLACSLPESGVDFSKVVRMWEPNVGVMIYNLQLTRLCVTNCLASFSTSNTSALLLVEHDHFCTKL
jgi:hypothetical protein